MRDSLCRPGWPFAWSVGDRVIEARPLAVRIEKAADLSGLSYQQILAFHDDGRLPFIELGAVRLVTVRDLEALVARLPRTGEPTELREPEKQPSGFPRAGSRKRRTQRGAKDTATAA